MINFYKKVQGAILVFGVLFNLFLSTNGLAQTAKTQSVNWPYKGNQFLGTKSVINGKVYAIQVGYIQPSRFTVTHLEPTVAIINPLTLKKEAEYTLNIKPCTELEKVNTNVTYQYFNYDGSNYYLVYDAGSEQFRRSKLHSTKSIILCQKFNKDFQPIGNSFPLLDHNIKNNLPGYEARIIVSNDSSKLAIIQSTTYQAANDIKIHIYNQSFKKVKEYQFKEIANYKFPFIRDVVFYNNQLVLMVNQCLNPSTGPRTEKCPINWIELDVQTGSVKTTHNELIFHEKQCKTKTLKFYPSGNKLMCAALARDFNDDGHPFMSNTLMVLTKNKEEISIVNNFNIPKENIANSELNALCFDDIKWQFGELLTLPKKNGKGTYIIAQRKYGMGVNSCDHNEQKNWRYFYVISLDENNKVINQRFFPINNAGKNGNFDFAGIIFNVVGDKLVAGATFSEQYYSKKVILDKNVTDAVPSILIIDPTLKESYYKFGTSSNIKFSDFIFSENNMLLATYEEDSERKIFKIELP